MKRLAMSPLITIEISWIFSSSCSGPSYSTHSHGLSKIRSRVSYSAASSNSSAGHPSKCRIEIRLIVFVEFTAISKQGSENHTPAGCFAREKLGGQQRGWNAPHSDVQMIVDRDVLDLTHKI